MVVKNKVKSKVKKFAWEKKAKIEKPKKTDFVKKEKKKKWAYKQKKKNQNIKKKFIAPRTVLGWEDREHISKPKPSDFKEKKKKPLKWDIPWLNKLLNPQKSEEPKREDFEEREPIKVGEGIRSREEFVEETKYEEPERFEENQPLLPKVILIAVGICYLLFFGLIVTMFGFIESSNYLGIENLFFVVAIISIILSAIFAYQRNIFRGFIYISLIVLAYILVVAIFAEPVLRLINVLLIILAVLPIEIYLVFYNK